MQKAATDPLISISEHRLRSVCDAMTGRRIAVIGDIMLDRYLLGRVHRLSPEAPVPVIDLDDDQARLGGASNVAWNVRSLGGEPILVGVVGNDASGRQVADLIRQGGFSDEGVFVDGSRPTTVKTRIIAHSQHVARVDRESRAPLQPAMVDSLIGFISSRLEGIDGVIFEDYNKGVIGRDLIAGVTALATGRGIPVAVDPKFENFFDFNGVTVFKPNKKEVEEALGRKLSAPAEIEEAGKALLGRLRVANILMTLGDQGMMLFEKDGSVLHVPTKARHVADVSGAGDTVIATLTMALLGGATVREASCLANFSGGIVCGYVGIVPIDRDELVRTVLAELNQSPHSPHRHADGGRS
jgi:rfaE bifunctional protein kinase chain/domain